MPSRPLAESYSSLVARRPVPLMPCVLVGVVLPSMVDERNWFPHWPSCTVATGLAAETTSMSVLDAWPVTPTEYMAPLLPVWSTSMPRVQKSPPCHTTRYCPAHEL